MHFTDAFIQSGLQCIHCLHLISSCIPWESNLWPWRYKRHALLYELQDAAFRIQKVTFLFTQLTLWETHQRASHLRDVDSGPEELQMFSHPLGFVFGVEDGQLSEHAHVSALQPQRRLQQHDHLLEIPTVLTHTEKTSQTRTELVHRLRLWGLFTW